MDSNPIKIWLRKNQRKEMAVAVLLGGLSLVGGMALLFLTFWFVYVIILFGTYGVSAASELLVSKRVSLPHAWRLGLSAVFIVLLFIGNARTSREYLSAYPRDNYRTSPAVFGGSLALIWLLAHSEASSKMISDLLFSGPRCVVASWNLGRKLMRLNNLDLETCSEVLLTLSRRESSISREELAPELPDAQWLKVINELALFDGVLMLHKDPVRLSLSEDLRSELLAIIGN